MGNEINWPTPAEWAAELRTTKKGQTYFALRTLSNDANCCLGILAEMAGAKPARRACFVFGDVAVDGYMLTEPRPDWMTDDISLHAARLNDSHYKTFAEIADWIDAGMEVPS